jgi:hypothetical protein
MNMSQAQTGERPTAAAAALAAKPAFLAGAKIIPGAETNPACLAGVRYLEAVLAKKPEQIVELFADDGIALTTGEAPITGKTNLLKFYSDLVAKAKLQTRIVILTPAGANSGYMGVAGEMNGMTATEPFCTVQFTTNTQGKITRLAAFFRPEALNTLVKH